MITVHHLEYSQSFRILWLLEELGMEYELKIYKRDPETRLAPAEYKAISPLGTAPVITDGDVAIAESNAIVDYILDKRDDGTMRPAPGSPERAKYLFWFHAAQGSLMPALTMGTVFGAMKARSPMLVKPVVKAVVGRAEDAMVTPRVAALMSLMEKDLGDADWFAGDRLTAADIVMSYPMEGLFVKDRFTDAHPNSKAWVARMRARPAYQRALEKDGTGQVAFTG